MLVSIKRMSYQGSNNYYLLYLYLKMVIFSIFGC